jgi:tetratricopeptide (TPR) repeat protein
MFWPRRQGSRRLTLVRLALALIILAALTPELFRYAAERRLYQASTVVRLVFAGHPAIANPGGALEWATSVAGDAAGSLPGDWRPLNLAGSALLLARQPDRALERYREALALGERPEIDVNVGRAYASLGRHDEATAAFLRAGWVSPAVLASLPASTRDALQSELRRLERELTSGRLAAPPALPP